MNPLSDELLEELAEKWLNGTLTPEEEEIFNQWYEAYSDGEIPVEYGSREEIRNRMLAYIRNATNENEEDLKKRPGRPDKVVQLPRRWLLTAGAAAAMLIILFGLFWYLKPSDSSAKRGTIAVNDIKPGGSKAILTLANGQRIVLDTARKGQLVNQSGSSVIKMDSGLLVYDAHIDNHQPAVVQYNTLTTPRGGQYHVVLPDGSSVWLNAASSITFPVTFTGSTREVKITGEAYFEVKQNASKPFIVRKGNTMVQVLGTHFDINAYDDEPDLKVTLLEGSVRVSEETGHPSRLITHNIQILTPGQQAQIDHTGKIKLLKNADVEGAVAWKNGYFMFDSETLGTILRQVSRWYDVEVQYKDTGLESQLFSGTVSRFKNVSELLRKLALTGAVHFDIGDKKIIVTK